ncbi:MULTISPECIES: CPBP family intramembrane glutamic endopeptidase [unclassified Saccharothrix]|uniref:CPBP family intramembrane glutamic endopeptidase n=1 Tax=unclassified Saccharothrix TaxID=2593673 RepID=UPI00307E8295
MEGTRVDPPPVGGKRSGWRLLGVFLVAELVWFAVSVGVLVVSGADDARLRVDALLVLLVLPTTVAALVGLVGAALVGAGPRPGRVGRALAWRWSWRDFGIGLLVGVGGLLITIPAAAVWTNVVGDDAGSAVGEAFEGRHLSVPAAVAMFLAVWLVAPLGEEILFRGVLWRALEQWGWNRWVVFGTTCAVFAVAHMELLRTPLLLLVSLPVGFARLITGNLLASVVAHQTNNFLPAVGLLLLTTT